MPNKNHYLYPGENKPGKARINKNKNRIYWLRHYLPGPKYQD